MHCADRENLSRLLTNAALAYSDAVSAMANREGEALKQVRELADTAHTVCEDRRKMLAAHESVHGCGASKSAGAGL